MDKPGSSPPQPDRRNALTKAAAIVVGGIISIVAPISGIVVFLDPLRRKSATGNMVRVGSIGSLPTNGEPRKVPVLDTQIDAWNKTLNVPVGAVYLEKTGPKTVRALNAVCPHLGCSVSFSANIGHYACPCHKSSFSLDGKILDPKSPAPRGMDELETEVRPNGEVWVKFQNFRKGVPEKDSRLMKAALDWLDQRTGYKGLLHEALFENIPGGARWRYVWGSTLAFCFTMQVITGIFLWMAYSPSSQTAWESVYFIQHQMAGGWFLRGLHHFIAQAMTILLVLHLMQIVIDGAYKAPREVNFWFGFVLLLLVLALSLTGYLLPWDQKGYWATAVATNIAGISPGIGPELQTVVVGGSSYGHHTLTRFFALHGGLIPLTIIALIVGHVALFRKHGITPKQPITRPDGMFWPEQVLRDAVACLVVLLVVIFFILRYHGAPLGAPADPSEQYAAARPEWYFLFLYQLLKYFPGKAEVFGAIILPTILMGVVVAMPFIGKWRLGHRFNLIFLSATLGMMGLLTFLALHADKNDPDFQAAVAAAHRDDIRAVELAGEGIPTTGAITLLRNDALTQGPRLFSRNCAACHRFDGNDGLGNQLPKDSIAASDLKGFASREWLSGLFDPNQVVTPRYWGGTVLKDGDMVAWITDHVPKYAATEKEDLRKVMLALSAEAGLKSQAAADSADSALIAQGRKLLVSKPINCIECHKFHEFGKPIDAPDLTGYGSRDWLMAFISDPSHERFYGANNDRMPSFGTEKTLTDREIGLIADWLRGEWWVPQTK